MKKKESVDTYYVLQTQNDPLFSGYFFEIYSEYAQAYGYCRILKKNHINAPAYNPHLCQILTTAEIKIYNQSKECEEIINGLEFQDPFFDGFIDGIKFFEDNYGLKSKSIYEINTENYIRELHDQYFHIGHNGESGWNYVRHIYPSVFNQQIIYEFGYNSGLVYSVDELKSKHNQVFEQFSFNKNIEEQRSAKKEEFLTATESLKDKFKHYGFFSLQMVEKLSAVDQEQIVNLISTNSLPYRIAMFDYLGFLDYLSREHFNTKNEMYLEIAKWFGSSKDGRVVKGNINVLNEKSSENRNRYTAHLQKKSVEKDYNELK